MMNPLLPRRIDNTYRGHKLALWIFAFVVTLKFLQGLLAVFNGSYIASSADGIPLDTFTSAAAQTIVAIFALLGYSNLIIALLCALVFVRYRSLISFMFALLMLNFLAKELILHFIPLVRTATAPGPAVNLILFSLMIVGLALSLWSRRDLQAQSH